MKKKKIQKMIIRCIENSYLYKRNITGHQESQAYKERIEKETEDKFSIKLDCLKFYIESMLDILLKRGAVEVVDIEELSIIGKSKEEIELYFIQREMQDMTKDSYPESEENK